MLDAPTIGIISHPRRRKLHVLALVVEALYRSRYLRAERTMQRYRDVIDRAKVGVARDLKLRSERQHHGDD